MKYNYLSPDGFPIHPTGFKTIKEAKKYLIEWCNNYKKQGYYSQTCNNGYVRQISPEHLPGYCELVKNN